MRHINWSAGLAMLLMLVVALASCSQTGTTVQAVPEMVAYHAAGNDISGTSYETVAEDGDLTLGINRDTTDISVADKRAGRVWDTAAAYGGKQSAGEIFTLTYYDQKGATNTYQSYEDCVFKGSYQIDPIQNGVKVKYTVGDINQKLYAPNVISQARYRQFYDKLDEDGKELLDSRYFLVDLSQYSGDSLKQVETNYPEAKKGSVYCIRNKKYNDDTMSEISETLKKAGYTAKDYAVDSGKGETASADPQVFQLSIYYTLENGRLTVRVPEKEIFYYKEYSLCSIDLLPWFLSAQTGDSGYYLLPDGSGSIMNFFNGKGNLQDYYEPIYGVDKSRYVSESTMQLNDAVFPVFGVKNGKSGVFAVIEDGQAFAGVEANPGNDSMPPRAWAQFRVNEVSSIQSFTDSPDSSEHFNISQARRYGGDLKVSYTFLAGQKASYVGMARLYQQRLFSGRRPLNLSGYSATAQIIPVIDMKKNILGISVQTQQVLTTFAQAARIAQDLKSNGVSSLSVQLSGWLKGGYRNSYTVKPSVQAKAGNQSGFLALAKQLSAAGIGFYPDAEVQYAWADAGKPRNRDVSAFLNKRIGLLYSVDPSVFELDTSSTPSYILRPQAVTANIEGLWRTLSSWGFDSLSLRSFGADVNSNYNEKDFTERQTALTELRQEAAKLASRGCSLMGGGAIADLLPYLSRVNRFPLESDGFDNTDYSVPFTAMVASGYVEYTGEPINLSASEPTALLRLLESGAGARYVLTADHNDKMIESDFNWLYAARYGDVKGTVLETWKTLSRALDGCYGKRITDHERLADGVFRTTFEGGNSIVVNYSGIPVRLPGTKQTVGAYGFLTERGNG